MRLVIAFLVFSLNAADWPHWRGPDRSSHSSESSGWDEGVRLPDEATWEAEFGDGATAPLVIGDTLYTLGWRNGQDTLYAVEAATGKTRWSQSYPCPKYGRHATGDQGMYRGVTATPEYDADSGYLYSLSTDGDLRCWDTADAGKTVWSLNLYERYKIPRRPQVTGRKGSLRDYGYTSAPLVVGNHVLVEVGAAIGNVIAYDKKTGKEQWRSENKDPAGHSGGLSPITVEGVACVAVITARHLSVFRVDNGQEVAKHPWITDFINNIATPHRHRQSRAGVLQIQHPGHRPRRDHTRWRPRDLAQQSRHRRLQPPRTQESRLLGQPRFLLPRSRGRARPLERRPFQ